MEWKEKMLIFTGSLPCPKYVCASLKQPLLKMFSSIMFWGGAVQGFELRASVC
jgi:hypothetical protein